MDLTQAKQFLTVYECGKITTASEKLNITQSTLSRSMQRLEEELGRPLFERNPSGTQLTQWGEVLLPAARKMIGLYEDVIAEVREDAQSGTIRIGVLPTIAPFYLPKRLAAFRAVFPEAQVRVVEETTDSLLTAVRHGELDLAVVADPIDARNLEVTPLLNDRLVFVCSEDSPLAAAPSVSLDEVKEQPFIVLYETHCMNKSTMSLCVEPRDQPVVLEKTNQFATVMELVKQGHGVSIVPEMALDQPTLTGLIVKEIRDAGPVHKVIGVTNPYRYVSRLVEHLLNELITDKVV